MAVNAKFFDGERARDREVTVELNGGNLVFSGQNVVTTSWTIAGLHPIDPPAEGQPFRLTHDSKPGSRLVFRDDAFIKALVSANPHLKGGYSLTHLKQVAVWTFGGLAVLLLLGYVFVAVLPQKVAFVLPEEWRNRVGNQIVTSLVDKAKKCSTPGGDAAKSAMIAVLAEGNPDLPPISMEIYDLELINAFAAPGGKIIFTRGILKKADRPEEIAGVLAHEIGHVAHRHPETQLVRLTGLQVLISIATGTSGGDFTSNVAAIAALLSYSREAEREADAYARSTLDKANVDPTGLRSFFEKLMKLDGKKKPDDKETSALDRIGNVFSTHPGTEERIKEILPLPPGRVPVPVLSPNGWKDLQSICG